MKQRNSGIELTRILFMIGLMLIHYKNHALSYISSDSVNGIWLYFITTISVGGVNFFIMISGYYLARNDDRKLIKVVSLLLQAVLFNLAFYIGSIIMGRDVLSASGFISRMIPENWYVILYCCLYIISPYCNVLIKRLTDDGVKKLVVTSFLLFSVLSYLNDIMVLGFGPRFYMASPISLLGSSSGVSIVNFVMLYLIGAYLSRGRITINKRWVALVLTITMIMIFLLSLMTGTDASEIAWSYNSPFVIIVDVAVILLIKDSSFNNRIINELSKGTYTCYLFHSNLMVYTAIGWAVTKSLPMMIAHMVIVGIGLFVISYAVYRAYNLCTGWFIRLVKPYCDRISINAITDD